MGKILNKLSPFHLAIPVNDLVQAKNFYQGLLGAEIGRSDPSWIDFNFFGHQLVCHLSDAKNTEITNPVDNHEVPVPHFGIVLDWDIFHKLADKLKHHQVKFIIEPTIRFKGKVGEQATLFLCDPAGNAIEFKSFKDPANLFRKD
jgi:extradiol dioxygenase family protein